MLFLELKICGNPILKVLIDAEEAAVLGHPCVHMLLALPERCASESKNGKEIPDLSRPQYGAGIRFQ